MDEGVLFMRNIFLGTAIVCALGFAVTTNARGVDYSNPYDDEATHGLHFSALEFAIPRDPLLWSSDPGWGAHHTPADMLAPALGALRAAIPVGTLAEEATNLLHKAGARCSTSGAGELVCRYRDVQTPYGGEYWDNVVWQVKLSLADGRVGDLAVSRDWSRQ